MNVLLALLTNPITWLACFFVACIVVPPVLLLRSNTPAWPCHTCYDADVRTIMCSDGSRRCGACCNEDRYDVETGEYQGAPL